MTINRTLGIAVGAGLASALLFAASAKGAALAFVVAYVTPLPIMIATLGFGQATGLFGAAVACCAIAAVLGLGAAVFFGVMLGFPSWWLGYLSLLARPSQPQPADASAGPRPALIWYPIGRVVAWGAVLMAAVVLALGAATVVHFGSFDAAVAAVSAHLQAALSGAVRDELTLTDSVSTLVHLLPALLAASTFVMLMLNLWLAGRVVQRSGLLTRSWPALPEHLRLPRSLVAVLVLGGTATVLGGLPGMVGSVLVAPVALAFAFQGLGAAHALTRGLAARGLILLAVYFVTFSLVPSLLALAVLGVVDCLLPLRNKRPPTVLPTKL